MSKSKLDHTEGWFDLTCENVAEGDEIVKVDGSRAWVGYLTGDDDIEFPFDDGWYTIVARGKYQHGGKDHRDDERTFQQALGLDREWNKDIDDYKDQAYDDVLTAALKAVNPDGQVELKWYDNGDSHGEAIVRYKRRDSGPDRILPFRLYWSREAQAKNGHWVKDIWTFQMIFRGRTVVIQDPDERAEEIWQAKWDAGLIGNPYAVLLDVYDHSGVAWSVHGGGMNCQWDTSGGAGLWIPSPDCIKQIETQFTTPGERWAEAVRMAKGACETYTDYCNGWGYAIVVEEFELVGANGEDEDGDWQSVDYEVHGGILGYQYALEALKEEMTSSHGETETTGV